MKDLDKYFEKAKRQEEVVPVSEIDRIISQQGREKKWQSCSLWATLFQRKRFAYATSGVLVVLLGVIFLFPISQPKPNVDQEVFIPDTQRRVMHLVKNISDRPKNREIRISQFGSDSNPQITGIPIHLRSKFELSEDQLKLIGIKFFEEYIQYEGNVKGRGYVSFRILRTGSEPPSKFYPLEVDGLQRPGIMEYEFYPWFMTDEAGYQGFRYRFRDEPALKTTSSFFLNAIDQLIPIQIARPGFKKVIFWFSQTPELMNILESAAKISNDTKISDWSNTDKINRTIQIEIFPTITAGNVKVIANVLKEQKLEIALLNSSGEILQVPVSDQRLNEGEHTFSMNLSALEKGLYFVRIKSNPGVTTIHRLFKE